MTSSGNNKGRLIKRILLLVIVAVAAWAGKKLVGDRSDGGSSPDGPGTPAVVSRDAPSNSVSEGDAIIAELVRTERSGVVVESAGRVEKILPDDDEGSRHQRFIIRLANGRTLLVSHNIDLAPRVPIDEGDDVEFRGQYEWNDRGGVLHWTHHDPDGRRPGGWLLHERKIYQ